jgi:hypothetical protein
MYSTVYVAQRDADCKVDGILYSIALPKCTVQLQK